MTKSFISTDPYTHSSENTWFTPKKYIEKLGPFDLDPCTVSSRPFDTAKSHFCYDNGDNGLTKEWHGEVWLNPPYGKEIIPFIEKFIAYKKGVVLVFARMGSEYAQKLVRSGAIFYMLRKRVAFINKDGISGTNAGADSCLVFFDTQYIEKCENNFEGVLMRGKRH